LLRAEHGTWLGITRQGRLAVLTNFREENASGAAAPPTPIVGAKSRGGIANAWLTLPPDSPETTEAFVKRLLLADGGAALAAVGGFSLLCGRLEKESGAGGGGGGGGGGGSGEIRPLAIVSNRAASGGDGDGDGDGPGLTAPTWVAGRPGEVLGLSNSAFADPWPKVEQGAAAFRRALEESVQGAETEEELISRLFRVLSVDTLPARREGEAFESYSYQLRNSVFIRPLEVEGVALTSDNLRPRTSCGERPSDPAPALPAAPDMLNLTYGTQKQTVILVSRSGHVTFIERTLFDHDARPLQEDSRDRRFTFEIDGWNNAESR
jgi:uncharacterized protein with NRDE domain